MACPAARAVRHPPNVGLDRIPTSCRDVPLNVGKTTPPIWPSVVFRLSCLAPESPELSGRAVAALLAESPDQLMARSGQIVLVSDVAATYGIREPDGTTPPNLRSMQLLMRLSNHTTLARFIPGFIRLPMSLFLYFTSSSMANQLAEGLGQQAGCHRTSFDWATGNPAAEQMQPFHDYVCVVTGATRGIGRGIALGLGELGAIVYITGRTAKPTGSKVGGSLEETASEINFRGGKAVPVVMDHTDDKQVTSLFEQIRREQRGRLDVLVNNVYTAVPFLGVNDGKAYYEIDSCTPGEAWDLVNNAGLRNHYICSTLATRLMLDYRKQAENISNPGLIVNVSSIGGRRYLFNACYGIGKAALDRMTADMSVELKRNGANVCVISLWPGLVRTEELMHRASNLSSDHILSKMDPRVSESPELSGRAVAALLAESPDQLMARSGQIVLVSDVAATYGIREPDGTTPPNLRSMQLLMRLSNHTTLARFIPGFIRLPMSLFLYLMSCS
ncbi:dehydrogenase/reductase SDR family member 1 [Paragonimus westermani]|uniref:Dehydrogenase/reductase SDR family member 1 n=1 Tax=Paragonimus westermani TaxID=34504 RepID=A0A5J4NY27_9TREM|nr:dehydrogenase/reductase SDR family member 1 [Paragonimus westermani]